MKILALTNLYPPQELGGYGRSIADFVWGLTHRGHSLSVLCSDAPYLGPTNIYGPSGETVNRTLLLKGSYEGGVHQLQDPNKRRAIEDNNREAIQAIWKQQGAFDGVLLGNIDLLGVEIISALLAMKVPVLHHIGFVNPPFHPNDTPRAQNYQPVAASQAVARALLDAGFQQTTEANLPVVYPGVRCDLFGPAVTGRQLPPPLDGTQTGEQLGSERNPLKVCFAGLMMNSKGAHILVQAMVLLHQRGFHVEGHLAGGDFQPGYRQQLESLLKKNRLDSIRFTGQLNRQSLARFYGLHHVCVFPSIRPEAFGIVGAEAMASGLALISSGIGGAAELFENHVSGLLFQAGKPSELADHLEHLGRRPHRLAALASAGSERARKQLSVTESARQLEELFTRKRS